MTKSISISDLSASIFQWKHVLGEQIRSMAGDSPTDWYNLIKNEGAVESLPKSYGETWHNQSVDSISLRLLLGIHETIKRIKKPGGHSFTILLKADEILVDFYFLSHDAHVEEGKIKKLLEESEEWLGNMAGLPVSNVDRQDVRFESILGHLKRDEIFMAMCAKKASSAGIDDQLRQMAARIRAKGQLELDGFWNNRKNLEKSLRQVLQCSICGNFAQNLQSRLPCLHLTCDDCLLRSPNCPFCPSSLDSSPKTIPSFVTISFTKLLQDCSHPDEPFECTYCVRMADKVCLECNGLYCHDHGGPLYHNESHTLLSAINLLDPCKIHTQLFTFCPLHKRPLKYFCPHCQSCLCSHPSCTSAHLDHMDFSVANIQEAKANFELELLRFRATLNMKASLVEARLKKAEMNEIEVANEQERINDAILTDFNVLSAVLADLKTRFLDDLEVEVEKFLENSLETRKRLEEWIAQFENLDSQLRFLDKKSTWAQITTFQRNALSQCQDTLQGSLLHIPDLISFPDFPLAGLVEAIESLPTAIQPIHPSPQPQWIPFLATQTHLIEFCLCQEHIYVCQHATFNQYQLSLYNVTDLSTPVSKYVLSDTAIALFGSLAVDNQTGNVYTAVWKKKGFDFSRKKATVPHLVIDQYSNYLEKEKTFVLDWLRLNTPTQIVQLKAHDRFVYVNDSESVFELSAIGHVTRAMNFGNILQISHFLLDFDHANTIAFDFPARKAAKFDWNTRAVTCMTLNLGGDQKIVSVSKDDYGHFFLLDDIHGSVTILDHNLNPLTIRDLPPFTTDTTRTEERKSSSTVDQMVSRLKTSLVPEPLPPTRTILAMDDYLYISDACTIWRSPYY